MRRLLGLVLLVVMSATLAEEQKTEKVIPQWVGDVQFGYVSSSGNTENTNINGKLNLKKDDTDWVHLFNTVYYSSSDSGNTTAQRYKLAYQLDYKLNEESSYWFINSSYEDDRFNGYDYRATLTTGYGKRLYNNNDMTLDGEIGAGLRKSEPQPGTSPAIDNEGMLRVAMKYNWDIAKDRKLTSSMSVEEGEEIRVSTFDIGFVTMIAGDLSLKAAYEARHVSLVPVGNEKLDTIITLNLLYKF